MSISTELIFKEGYTVSYLPGLPIDVIGTWDSRWLDGLPVVYQINGRTADNYVGQYDCPALYIGRTEDLAGRIASHAREKKWWEVVCCVDVDLCPSLAVAIAHEQARIYDEIPLFNQQYNRRQPKSWQEPFYEQYYGRYRGVDWWFDSMDAMTETMMDGILHWDNMEVDEANGVISDDPLEYDAALKRGDYE